MRIVFMGTPDFAAASLEALLKDASLEVVGVITQPDRPKGRGHKLVQTPVKECALAHNLPVWQPEKVKNEEFIEVLRDLAPELIVVAAFGQFLPESILNLPKYGCINVHASLLPKLRGAAPIQYAILEGHKVAGVTIMQMAKGMDTGDMIETVEVEIGPEMTGGELWNLLSAEGAKLLVKVIQDIAAGTAVRTPQKEEEATYATLLTRELERIDWTKSAEELHNQIRAFDPIPGSFTTMPEGKNLKVWKSKVVVGSFGKGEPGTILCADKKGLVVATGNGYLQLLEVQPESKKRMEAQVLINGKYFTPGEILGADK